MESSKEASTSAVQQNSGNGPKYAENHPRVSKDNMFMILALLMEDFPVDEKVPTKFVEGDHCKKVGAVLVLPNEIFWAADCSRGDGHAVARLLVKHHNKANGCKMFMSRKPCRICAKLLVQSKVKQVLYPPLKPEYYLEPEAEPDKELKRKKMNNIQRDQVDRLFVSSPIAQTKFVLQVEKSILAEKQVDTKQYKEDVKRHTNFEVTTKYHLNIESSWLKDIKEQLPWPAFDEEMKKHVQELFVDVIEWAIRASKFSGGGPSYTINLNTLSMKPTDNSPFNPEGNEPMKPTDNSPFNPEGNETHKKQANHFIEMARLIAERTDDPKTGVGVVIVSYPEMEILSIGWNGYPRKAHYGEFPRASDSDDAEDNKFSYVIHAEQNALMMRNTKNIKGAILFVTKPPCDECAPLIAMEGIKTVVVDADVRKRDKKKHNQDEALPALGYNAFPDMVSIGKFVCYQTK